MARKRPLSGPKREQPGFPLPARPPEQLVFPFQLRVGDVVLEDGVRAEVVALPSSMKDGKTTRAWIRPEGGTVQREAVWGSWQRVRVVRTAA